MSTLRAFLSDAVRSRKLQILAVSTIGNLLTTLYCIHSGASSPFTAWQALSFGSAATALVYECRGLWNKMNFQGMVREVAEELVAKYKEDNE